MTDIPVIIFDNDGNNGDPDPEDDNLTSTDTGFYDPDELGAGIPFYIKHLNQFESAVAGTGNFNPFLRLNGSTTLRGFNTDENIAPNTQTTFQLNMVNPDTDALRLGDIPIVYLDLNGDGALEAYYQLNLDINESKTTSEVSLEELQIFTSTTQATLANYRIDDGDLLAFRQSDGFTLHFDLDATGDNKLILRDDGAGSGSDDYVFYIPTSVFGNASPNDYVTLYSQLGPTPADDGGFAEWKTVASSKIVGTKFNDIDGDGIKDTGEAGLSGFTMYIDINNNNKLDAGEITAESGADGLFTFYSLLGGRSYTIREVLSVADLADPTQTQYLPDIDGNNVADTRIWDQTTGDVTGDQVVTVTTAGIYNMLVGNRELLPSLNIVKDATIAGGTADAAGEQINYTITVANTGNMTLTGVSVSDPYADAGSLVRGADVFGDGDNLLEVGETWGYTATHTVTQAEIDAGGNFDGPDEGSAFDQLRNVATADSNETGPDTDDASVPVEQNPAINVTKAVAAVDADGNGLADAEGDVIDYSIKIENTGNITLTDVTVTDTVEAYGATNATYVSGDADGDGKLDVDEEWTFSASYTLTQDDLDGKGGGNELLDNVGTGDTEETDPDSDSETVPLVYNPKVDLEKYVSVTGAAGAYVDADSDATNPDNSFLGPNNVNIGSDVWFKVTVANTGNVTLTDVDISDENTTGGSPWPVFDLVVDGELTLNAVTNFGATLGGDTDGDGELDVGETWTIYYKQGFDPGQHINTATITTDENATDSDDAYYYSLINEGPGVGTPGFWGNLGGQFWDGKVNETKFGPNFPEGDLLIKGNTNGTVDSNGDQVVDGKDVGLLVGDYNMNGITDLGEDTLFIGLSDAKRLIDASQKTVNGDGVQMLGRDVVATWLNFLAGNNIGDADTDAKSPQHYIDDAIDWMQTFGGKNGNGAQNDLTDNIKTESFDIYDPAHATVKTSTPQWKSPQFLPDDPHSAAQLHNALDYYNNHGQTEPGGTQYAHDRDDATFAAALKVAQSAEYVGYADISSGDAVHDSAIMTNDQMLVI